MDERSAACAEVAEACLCFNLRRATRLLSQLYDAALRPSGLRITQLTALVAVQLGGEVSMQVLAGRLGTDRTTLTRNLKGLEEQGLLSSSPGRDRRSRLVSLTDRGRQALDKALPYWRQAQQQAVQALGPEQASLLLPVLGHISEFSKASVATVQADSPEQKGENHAER